MGISWKEYCRKNKVKWEYENQYDVLFTAPKGQTFGNDSRRRFVEDIDELSNRDIVHLLTVF